MYCGAHQDPETNRFVASAMFPDGTLYPGIQMMCEDAQACLRRIHEQYHGDGVAAFPECDLCKHCEPIHL